MSSRRTASRWGLALASLVLAVAAAEVLFALRGAPPESGSRAGPEVGVEGFVRADAALIHRIVPSSEAYPHYRIGAHGYRTGPFESGHPDALRVVLLGDSTVFGVGVARPETCTVRLEHALETLLGDLQPVEVLSLGVPGYTTRQTRLQVEVDVPALAPDVVVLLVTAWNDSRPVRGPTDAELTRPGPPTLLAGSALARALWAAASPAAPRPGSAPRPRVSPSEMEANLADAVAAIEDLGAIAVIATTIPELGRDGEVDARLDAAQAVAQRVGCARADARPWFDAVRPTPLSVDGVHPNALGHRLITSAVLPAVIAGLASRRPANDATRDDVADATARRLAWTRAWLAALQGDVPSQRNTLLGADAPPDFSRLVTALAGGTGPEAVQFADLVARADPWHGRDTVARSLAARLLDAGRADLAWDTEAHLRPTDPWVACFGGRGAFLSASAEDRDLGRACVLFAAWAGLPTERVDTRVGRALHAAMEGAYPRTVSLLDEVLAADPRDARARIDRAQGLRRTGRRALARDDLRWLVESVPDTGSGRLAAGLLAFDDQAWHDAEAHLSAALELEPGRGLTHRYLGQVLYEQDRLDEAEHQLTLARGLLGRPADVEELLAEIAARRRAPSTADAPDR